VVAAMFMAAWDLFAKARQEPPPAPPAASPDQAPNQALAPGE
jgi:hypothetical protein